MCDYSLEAYRSRPAQLGEQYETHQFPSYSIGFIAPATLRLPFVWPATPN